MALCHSATQVEFRCLEISGVAELEQSATIAPAHVKGEGSPSWSSGRTGNSTSNRLNPSPIAARIALLASCMSTAKEGGLYVDLPSARAGIALAEHTTPRAPFLEHRERCACQEIWRRGSVVEAPEQDANA